MDAITLPSGQKVDNKLFWVYNTFMNSKINRKRRTDRNMELKNEL